jgi:ABC-type nitrate/sulfonate/bicarbonate transport system permease component
MIPTPRLVHEVEKDEPSVWSVILVTVALAVLCFGFVVSSEKYHEHVRNNPDAFRSFNVTLTKDSAEDKARSEGIRISVSYATAILGFIVGTCLGMVIGVLCCTRIIGQDSSSEYAEKSPLLPNSRADKLRVV